MWTISHNNLHIIYNYNHIIQRKAMVNVGLALRWVNLDEMLYSRWITSHWTPLVGLDVRVYASIAKHKSWSGESSVVGTHFSAEGAQFAVNARGHLVIQVHWGRRGGQGGEGFNAVLVLRRVPPLQELQEEHTQGQTGGQGHCHTTHGGWENPLQFHSNAEKNKANALIWMS